MHYLNEENIFIFLVQIFLLLGISKFLGEMLRRWHQPALPAEIFTGVLLGPTILGRVWPQAHQFIFPGNQVQTTMLETVAWFGVLFLLLETGLEIDLMSAWRQRSEVLKIAIADIVIPMGLAFVVFYFLPSHYIPDSQQKILFVLFMASVMAISAMPIAARALNDLNMAKTDLSYLIMSALSVNDILGWAIFSVILGLFAEGQIHVGNILNITIGTMAFTGVALTLGRTFAHYCIDKIKEQKVPEPGSSLTFISLLAILCGAITHNFGIHALFGFFIAGIMVGDARSLPEKSRQVISQMVYAIFVPLFFAGIGLKIDFLKNLDWFLVLLFIVVGITVKFVGAWMGVYFTSISKSNRLPIAIAHTTGGMMEIVVGLVALEQRLITEPIFTAIVFSSMFSSILLGPWLNFAIQKRKEISFLEFFSRRGVVPKLRAMNKEQAIEELAECASEQEGRLSLEAIAQAVLAREAIVGTALEAGIAVPHARLTHLRKPLIVFGRSSTGIHWDSPDGEPTRNIFMILTPLSDDDVQVQILRAISRAVSQEATRNRLNLAEDSHELWDILHREFTEFQIVREGKKNVKS